MGRVVSVNRGFFGQSVQSAIYDEIIYIDNNLLYSLYAQSYTTKNVERRIKRRRSKESR